MEKKLKCKRHKFIGQKFEILPATAGMPVICFECGKIYFSNYPIRVRKISRHDKFTICISCAKKILCCKCGRNFHFNDFYLAECLKCGKEVYYCRKCSKNILLLPDRRESRQDAVLKYKDILKEVLLEAEKYFPESLENLNELNILGELPPYLLFYFNIALNGIDNNPLWEDIDGLGLGDF